MNLLQTLSGRLGLVLGAGLCIGSFGMVSPALVVNGAPPSPDDQMFVKYKLYDAMNAVIGDHSPVKAHDGCEQAKARLSRTNSDDYLRAQVEECFGYVAEINRDVAAACRRWDEAARLYRNAMNATERIPQEAAGNKFLHQERSRNRC